GGERGTSRRRRPDRRGRPRTLADDEGPARCRRGADLPDHRHGGGPARRPRDRRAAPGPAAQPDPALHGRDVRRGGAGGGRGPDPLPGRPVLLLRDGGGPLTPPHGAAARRYDAKAPRRTGETGHGTG